MNIRRQILAILLPLVALLPLVGMGQPAAVQAQVSPPEFAGPSYPATPGWTPFYTENPGSVTAGLNYPSEWVDGASNLFVGWMHAYTQASNTYYDVRRYNPAGQQTGQWRVQPDSTFKADGGQLTPTGADLLVVLTAHGPSDGTTRPLIVGMQRIAGVFTPYAQGIPAGKAGAQIPPGQAEVALTMDELVAALNTPSSALYQAEARLVKNNSQLGAERAISGQGVLTVGNTPTVLYQFTKDRIYETFNENAPGFWPKLRLWAAGSGGK